MDNETEKKKLGRPLIVIDQERVEDIERLASVLSIKQIADFFGFDEDTFTAIKKRQPEVNEAYLRGKSKCILSVAKSLIKQADEGNTAAQIFYLKTQAGWKETAVIESTVKPRNFNDFYNDDDDDPE